MNRAQWTAAVDQLMRRAWCIGIDDAGMDEQQLAAHWRDGQTPAAFVEWFAEKYDLIRFEQSPSVRTLPATFPGSGSRRPPTGA